MHDHFNGTCEQSARNYHGAIARNFTSGKLGARLSCKPATPYNRIVSGALVPLEPGEIPETETPRAIIVRNGSARAKEVRAFAIQQTVYAEQTPSYGGAARVRLPQEIVFAVQTLLRPDAAKRKRQAAARRLDDFLRTSGAALVNRKQFCRYMQGKTNAIDLIKAAGLLSGL